MDAKRDIQIYINSPGGSVYAGLGIYDTMQYINPDISTICLEWPLQWELYYYAQERWKKNWIKASRVMIHQPLGKLKDKSY